MPIITTNFIAGRMNQSVDERLLPPGEYIEALNVRLGSTETTEMGALENSKGNTKLTTLQFNGANLQEAICIGAYDDGANETMYWFVTSVTADMIVSFNTKTTLLNYHVVDAGSILNFDSKFLITGVDKIGDLLFYTDDLNPPRRINVTRAYTNVTAADLNVIVQPPLSSPTINLFTQVTEANYMETRMISFAYRYQYRDEEYSALSQFSDIAFVPGVFSLDTATNLNGGMKNIYNAVNISFNVGGKNVIGVDLIFKFSDSNILNIIEKFKKQDLGWADDSIQTQSFSNSKIYTILPESELLRLYDNVPLVAKAQTIIANRLMYGNYEDGRDVIDLNGINCQMLFEAETTSTAIDVSEVSTSLLSGIPYTIDVSRTVPSSAVSIDYSSIANKLKSGAFLNFEFTFVWDSYTGNTSTVTGQQGGTNINATFTLLTDYATVFEMASSTVFQAFVGTTIDSFNPVPTSCLGTTLTDNFNCAVQNPVDSDASLNWVKIASGITALEQGIKVVTSPGSDIVTFQLPAIKFNDSAVPAAAPLYGYYRFLTADSLFLGNGNTKSLHSNRNYEVGVVYMDEYLRSTTALVSPDNTVFIPASALINKNQIKVTIPVNQRPPFWATKYKFVVKRAEGPYNTVYSNFYYSDTTTNTVYFKLEGQNQTKVKTGDILRIKTDNSGALRNYQTAEALNVEAQAQNFLDPSANVVTEAANGDKINPSIKQLPGLYMEMKPTTFSVDTSAEATGWASEYKSDFSRRNYPSIIIPCFRVDASGDPLENLAIPQGSLVTFKFNFGRFYRNNNNGAEFYEYDKTIQASNNYDNLYAFTIGENIDFEGGICTVSGDESCNNNVFLNPLRGGAMESKGSFSYSPPQNEGNNRYIYLSTNGGDPSTGANQTNFLYLGIKAGTQGVTGHKSRINGRINVQLSNTLITFETIPVDVDNDIYYEDDKAYDISTTSGVQFHDAGSVTGDQNQTGLLPALVNLGFFDCFAFGNGIESFKVEDSLVGQSFTLGQRVTSVSSQDFKKADRFAGMTYSGTFNEETNINKLNEFNLGLVNFKDLEVIYGPIEVLHGRETDILVLQEDKISYVLAGKNLLSSAAAGGAITNTAEVLGNQIARIEEYGISKNPESFVSYGFDKFFTDVKRNAVLKLSGSGQSEQLSVISDTGMRSFFRNTFTDSFETQKLGGFDPYMGEFVLSTNSLPLPTTIVPINCNSTLSRQDIDDASTYTLNLGTEQGTVAFDFIVTGTVNLNVIWNSITVINQSITGNSAVNFIKNSSTPTTAVVTITPAGSASFDITPKCPSTPSLIIRQMTLGSPADSGKFIHNEFFWKQGTFTSPVSSELIQLNTDTANIGGVYIETAGNSSTGLFPPDNATVTMQSNKKDNDDFVFDPAEHKFRRFVTPFDYTPAEWINIEGNSADVIPITNPSTGLYQASFTYENPNNFQYLYLTWDLRKSHSINLRTGATTSIACCSGPSATYYLDTPNFATATAVFTDSTLHNSAPNQFYQSNNIVREQTGSPGKLLPGQSCLPCGSPIPLCFAATANEVCCTACVYTSYSSSIVQSTRYEACLLAKGETYYHNGTGTTPVVNNFVYSDDKGTTILAAGYYSLNATSVIFVNSNGMVENLLTC
jgi:hypothetical protein